MRNRCPILALLCVLASLLAGGIASANSSSGAENRVWDFLLQEQTCARGASALTLDLHPGCDLADYDSASGSPLAAKGGLGSLGRAGKGRGVREVVGDSGDARKLFDDLRGSNPVTEVKLGVFTAPGANGGTVTFRGTSKSGPPKVDVHGIEDGIRKIKFVDQ